MHAKTIFLIFISVVPMASALAIPPPDLIMSAAQSVMQIAGVALVFVMSLLFLIRDFIKNTWHLHRRLIISVFVFLVLSLVALIFYWYGR